MTLKVLYTFVYEIGCDKGLKDQSVNYTLDRALAAMVTINCLTTLQWIPSVLFRRLGLEYYTTLLMSMNGLEVNVVMEH